MLTARFVGKAIILGIVAAALGWGVCFVTGWQSTIIQPLLVGVLISGWLFYEIKDASPEPQQPDGRDHLLRIIIQMAGAFIVAFAGLISAQWADGIVKTGLYALMAIGLICGLPIVARYNNWLKNARNDPTLFDERVSRNMAKSEKWAFLICMETALTMGVMDYLNVVQLSGAIVGFTAASLGIASGLFLQGWYEWQDGK